MCGYEHVIFDKENSKYKISINEMIHIQKHHTMYPEEDMYFSKTFLYCV